MNTSKYSTPQKQIQQLSFRNVNNCSNYETPNSSSNLSSRKTASFHLLPSRFLHTPPSRLKKVINPFEHALADRLHLPLICSPSLFKPPSTPKNNSMTQFEWTIEDVSSLTPANVEPHETQFVEQSPDPELEEKAQAAIRSYFKEQLIVPSPVECSVRDRHNNLSKNLLSSSKCTATITTTKSLEQSSSKSYRNIITQTSLTLPPILPNEVEKVLKKYFLINDNDHNSSDDVLLLNESVIMINCSNNKINDSNNSREVSRRLFDNNNSVLQKDEIFDIKTPEKNLLIHGDDTKRSPIVTPHLLNSGLSKVENFDDNLPCDTSFGAISPISILDTSKTNDNMNILDEFLSPQNNNTVYKSAQNVHDNVLASSSSMNMSIDISFQQQNDELIENAKKNQKQQQEQQKLSYNHKNSIILKKSKSFSEIMDTCDNNCSNNKMQISHLSGSSSSSSASDSSLNLNSSTLNYKQNHSETPIKKRYLSRKNLSHSFSSRLNNDDDDDDDDDNNNDNDNDNDDNNIDIENKGNLINSFINKKSNKITEISKIAKISSSTTAITTTTAATSFYNTIDNDKSSSSSLLYRTDSGFNELTSSIPHDESKFTADLKKRCGLDKMNIGNNLFEFLSSSSSSPPQSSLKSPSLSTSVITTNDVSMKNDLIVAKTNNISPMRCCSTPSKRLK